MAAPRQAKRLLTTWDRRWKAIRVRHLEREPTCRACRAEGHITAGQQVDHVNGRADRWEDYRDENLQTLCDSHHSVKTALENGSFGRAPGQARAKGCDEQGTPLDRSHPWHTTRR